MFIDRVKIRVKAGNGGNGCVSFRREKYVPFGGPQGGDGGRGGTVFFQVSPGETTLIDLHSRPFYQAENGGHGLGKGMHGKNGQHIVLDVPPGTVITDEETGEVIGELLRESDRLIIAKGGRGGRGNARFATPKRRAPRFAEAGKPGVERRLCVELKLVAQGGLVGLPNAGKSSLLTRLTRAHPRIADYPFTTLYPVLGTFSLPSGKSLILADIPGIIQGAHEGVGLGLEFLKHIERTVFLIFVLDLNASRDEWPPARAYQALKTEIEFYQPEILQRPQLLVFNKIDLMEDSEEVQSLVDETLAAVDTPLEGVFVVSARSDEGLEPLKEALRAKAGQWLERAGQEGKFARYEVDDGETDDGENDEEPELRIEEDTETP